MKQMIYCKWNITLLKQPTWTGRRWTSWQNLGGGQGRTWTWGLWLHVQVQHFNCSVTLNDILNYDMKCKKILKFPGFDWLAMWHCGLFYNTYLKHLQPFTRKGGGFLFHPLYPQFLNWSQFCRGALSGVGYSELILLFLEPAFLRHFSAHVLSLNMHSK